MGRVLPRRVLAGALASGAERQLGVRCETLDVLGVTSVVTLGLTLRAVEDGQAGHVVADLPRGQTVQVGPAVLPPVAVAPLQTGRHTGGLGLTHRDR